MVSLIHMISYRGFIDVIDKLNNLDFDGEFGCGLWIGIRYLGSVGRERYLLIRF